MFKPETLKDIPSVDYMLHLPAAKRLIRNISRKMLLTAVRSVLEEIRNSVISGKNSRIPAEKEILQLVNSKISGLKNFGKSNVINATGVIIHTALGRAVMPKEAFDSLKSIDRYCSLQMDIKSGRRGERTPEIEALLKHLTGAEAACVVNNNAAATIVILNTLAKKREVIISRGELVEIGGDFRLPEIMGMSQAVLREVGATNRTHLKDYENAINEKTGLLMHAHKSNYLIVGFTKEVGIRELYALGKRKSIPFYDDLGSGCLIDISKYGLKKEPLAIESVSSADIVSFSGDKLLGGPQCGIILGKKEYIDRIKKNPFFRAVRICKITAKLLETVLKIYLYEDRPEEILPVYKMLSYSPGVLRKRAENIIKKAAAPAGISIRVKSSFSVIGSGALPGERIKTTCLVLSSEKISAGKIADSLRAGRPPVVPRIEEDKVCLDLRTVFPDEDEHIIRAIETISAI